MAEVKLMRHLVDKEKVIIEGVPHYKLYFFDTMDGVVIQYTAPIVKSTVEELKAYVEQIKEEQKENVDVIVTTTNSEELKID